MSGPDSGSLHLGGGGEKGGREGGREGGEGGRGRGGEVVVHVHMIVSITGNMQFQPAPC